MLVEFRAAVTASSGSRHVGQTLHGGGGHFEDPSHLVDEPVPERCRPEGSEPYVMLYDVAPGSYEE